MSLADRVKAAKAAEVTVEGHRDEIVQELRSISPLGKSEEKEEA